MSKNYDIFISYRRIETADKAEHLFSLLEMAGYKGQVSFDKENFDGRFDLEILQRLDNCKDFIVVLAPGTLAELNEKDTHWYKKMASCPANEFSEIETNMNKSEATLDFVRLEIARALAKGKHIIPVVPVNTPEYNFDQLVLPDDIVQLKKEQAEHYQDTKDFLFKDILPKITKRLKSKPSKNGWMKWAIIVVLLLTLAVVSVSIQKKMDKHSAWEQLSKCHTQSDYEQMLECWSPDVANAAQDSINEFRRLKRAYLYVNVDRMDSVPVIWSPSVSLLQLRKISGLLDSMMYVGNGEFVMGDKAWEDIDGPMHKVVLTQEFYVSKYELTRDVWYAVMADSMVNTNTRFPITGISYEEALHFVSEIHRLTQLDFSLPTEAEWEYAAKGNTQEAYAGSNIANDVAYWKGNAQGKVHPVGGLSPNSRELYDMSGNVSEWCLDEVGDRHIIRGGNYASDLEDLRVGHREYYKTANKSDFIGMRLILKKQ